MLLWILVIILLLASVGTAPVWPHSAGYGYGPSGVGFVVVVVLIILLLTGRL